MPSSFITRLTDSISRIRKSVFFREFLGYGSSTVVEQASRLATNLAAAAILGPAVWGSWFVLNLILRYGSLFHLGAMNGMNRELPAALGRGAPEEADLLGRSALGFLLVAYSVAVVTILLIFYIASPALDLQAAGLTLVLLATQELFGYAATSIRTRLLFTELSKLQFVATLLLPLLAIPSAYIWGLSGFIGGQALTFLLLCLASVRLTRTDFRPHLDWARSVKLVRIGFPIMLVGLMLAVFATVDRWIILAILDEEALGQYSIAILALGAVGLLPRVIAQQTYPRMARSWAAVREPIELQNLARTQRNLTIGVVIPIVALLALVAPTAINWFLPEYEASIRPLLVSLLAPVFYCFGQGYGNIFNVIGLQLWYLAVAAIAIAVSIVVSLLLIGSFGLVGVAIGTVAGFAALAALSILLGAVALNRLKLDRFYIQNRQ